ncbi:hypothetical protein OIU84_008953 [Salix udensis]|uniref:Uncharacterized protein n=1 Tax=Salix udensis TaxID=889485 RepID=A0AAD6NY46_9ROSI|nr:hypothetical protein OIU84_008953 [Salix udensis]
MAGRNHLQLRETPLYPSRRPSSLNYRPTPPPHPTSPPPPRRPDINPTPSLELDAELRSIDAISAELVQVRTDVHKLTVQRQDMTAQLKEMNSEIVKAKMETQQVGAIKEEIETVQQEIQRGRKHGHLILSKKRCWRKIGILLAREIMKLRTELANAEKRARAAAAAGNPSPGYGRNYGRDEVGYGGSSYPDPNNPQQVQIGGGDSVPTFSSGAMSNGHYDTAHR